MGSSDLMIVTDGDLGIIEFRWVSWKKLANELNDALGLQLYSADRQPDKLGNRLMRDLGRVGWVRDGSINLTGERATCAFTFSKKG